MTRLIGKLTILLAVLLMPFGMVAPVEAHTSGMAMSHCPDQESNHQQKGVSLECTMACASALPAVEALLDEPPSADPIQFAVAPTEPLRGLHPDTATPPPKAS